MIEKASLSLTDEDALQAVELYPAWQTGTAYSVNDRIRYNSTLYRCVQAHTSQADWTPDATPALWTVVSLDEWPEWVQPTGAQDAYNKGDRVHYPDAEGPVYVSTIDNNVWSPEAYPAGWEVFT
jgi:hypothetical protein